MTHGRVVEVWVAEVVVVVRRKISVRKGLTGLYVEVTIAVNLLIKNIMRW